MGQVVYSIMIDTPSASQRSSSSYHDKHQPKLPSCCHSVEADSYCHEAERTICRTGYFYQKVGGMMNVVV